MTPDVVIIGAGFAGLSAAVDLVRRGARVLVLEARAVLGGRATTCDDPQTGARVDNGQHVLLGCYRETFRFLDAIGASDRVQVQANLDVEFIDRAGRRSRLCCPPLRPPVNLVGGLFAWDALDWRDRLAALRMRGPIRIAQRQARGLTRAIAASPGETVEGWLVRNGQTPRLREMLWEPLALASLNQSAGDAAAPWFARVLAEMFGEGSQDAAIGLPVGPLDEMYAQPARAFIEAHGGEVRTSAPARVVIDDGAVSHVSVRDERVTAGGVISAVPWFVLPDLFEGSTAAVDPVRRAAAATAASPVATVNLWLNRQVLNVPFLGLPGRTLQWVFDRGQTIRAGTSHLMLVASGAAQLMESSNQDLIELAMRELCEALPEARRAGIVRASVVRERRATFSLAPGRPARPGRRTAVRNLFLAGDWIETGLPATIEGAVVSGHRAADAASRGA
jgi:hydroxysqualene dehydroxylase